MESKRRAQSLFEPRTLTITHHIMFVTKCALPLCMLFLCAAGDAQHGLCEDNKCFALFLESRDFAEAQRSCRDTGGQLYDAARWGKLPALPVSRGIYWIDPQSGAEGRRDVHVRGRVCEAGQIP